MARDTSVDDAADAVQTAADLFVRALELPAEERADFVREQASADEALRDEVLSLLAHVDASPGFLETPPLLSDAGETVNLPDRLGSYRILARIGAGGMGVVYLAEQDHPRRRVALKVLRRTVATEEVRRRFAYEGEVLGRLQHAGIAQIHEASTVASPEGPVAFLAMEYVEGRSLMEFAAEHRLDARERVRLLISICDAVQHAHQRGVIHRDLKPANILVSHAGQPKVLDFGVARVVDSDGTSSWQTAQGAVLGTPAYMSPEQARGAVDAVDTRSDVFSLGVIAFELLAGERPHAPREVDTLPLHAALQLVQDCDARRLGEVRPELRGDLSTIVAKALEREPHRRYASVGQLGADLRAFLNDEPIAAHPPSTLYHWRKLVRRHRGLVASVVTVLLVLAVALVVTGGLAVDLRAQRDVAESERVAARAAERAAQREAENASAVAAFLGDVFAHGGPYVGRHDMTVLEAIEAASADVDRRFADRPDVAAHLHWRISSVLYSHGRYQDALKAARACLVLRERNPATLPTELAASHADVGNILQLLGRAEEARPSLELAVALFEEHEGLDDPYHETALVNLSAQLYAEADYERAEPMMRRALEGRTARYGADHAYTLTARNNLANLLRRTGRLDEALPELEACMRTSRRLLTDAHPNTITSIYNVADALRELERFEEAEELFIEAIELGRAHLPANHWQRGLYASRYGELLLAVDRLDEADELLTEGHRILERALGPDHERTQRASKALAELGRR